MNKGDERIREMFQQLKSEVEQNAPNFTDDWNAAHAKLVQPRRGWAVWQISAAAATTLILLGTGWWVFIRQSSTKTEQVEIVTVDTSAPTTLLPVISPPASQLAPPNFASTVLKTARPVSHTKTGSKNSLNITRRQHPVRQPQPPTALISQWRSPTESLLQIPGERLLKSVPRLDESVVNIKATISNQKN
jgi:cytoskeletal protein RodZ